MLGSAQKERQPEEKQMAEVSRKSLTLVRPKLAGEVIAQEDLQMMRPGTGLPAESAERLIGKRAKKDLSPFQQLTWDDVR